MDTLYKISKYKRKKGDKEHVKRIDCRTIKKFVFNENKNKLKTFDCYFEFGNGIQQGLYYESDKWTNLNSSGRYYMVPVSDYWRNVQALNLVNNGYLYNTRVGNKICMKSLELRIGFVTTPNLLLPHPTPDPTHYRVLIVYDRQTGNILGTEGYPPLNIVLGNANPRGNTDYPDFTSFQNMEYEDRFLILYDRIGLLPPYEPPEYIENPIPTQNAITNDYPWMIDEIIDLMGLVTTFSPTSTAPETHVKIGDVTSGALLIYINSPSNWNADGPGCYSMYGSTRIKFQDC